LAERKRRKAPAGGEQIGTGGRKIGYALAAANEARAKRGRERGFNIAAEL